MDKTRLKTNSITVDSLYSGPSCFFSLFHGLGITPFPRTVLFRSLRGLFVKLITCRATPRSSPSLLPDRSLVSPFLFLFDCPLFYYNVSHSSSPINYVSFFLSLFLVLLSICVFFFGVQDIIRLTLHTRLVDFQLMRTLSVLSLSLYLSLSFSFLFYLLFLLFFLFLSYVE